MNVFISAGEPSGDLHGANLIGHLQTRLPRAKFVGFGGPRMKTAGCVLLADMTDLAVMWLLEAIIRLPRFLGLLYRADQYFKTQRPAAAVLIDFPGFHWWIAWRAKAHGIPVFYYGMPQIWAWAPWRVRKLKRLTDFVLCKLPFEPDWLARFGVPAHFVGHPYFDELATRRLDQSFLAACQPTTGFLVTLLPGSRSQEVRANLPLMLATAERLQSSSLDVQFAIASYNDAQRELAESMASACTVPVRLYVGKTAELIEAADACLACSGSVSLELLYHTTPAVVVYRIARWAYALQDRFRLAKYITLVNLLACQDVDRRSATAETVPFPEYLTYSDDVASIACDLRRMLTNSQYRSAVVEQLRRIKYQHAKPGASQRAADFIAEVLRSNGQPMLRPHFRPSSANEGERDELREHSVQENYSKLLKTVRENSLFSPK